MAGQGQIVHVRKDHQSLAPPATPDLTDMVKQPQLGRTLRALREERGWSQRELARRAKVTQAYITLIETGERPHTSWEVLLRLARALGVPPARLDPERVEDLAKILDALRGIRERLESISAPLARPSSRRVLRRQIG